MNRRTLVLPLVVLLLALASQWLSRETRQEVQQAEAGSGAPDFFVSDFTATELGPDGSPARRVEGIYLAQFPDQQAVITEPRLTVYRPDGAPWELTAAEGRSFNRGERVHLSGGVRVQREGPEATEIVTDNLEVRPEQRYAETAAPVTMITRQGRIDAVGMQAFMGEERVLLHSQVRGTYHVR